MDKQILVQYIDACAQVEDTKREILKLKKARKRIEQDAVKGSSHEFSICLIKQTKRFQNFF